MAKPTDIDAYLAGLAPEARAALAELRRIVTSVAQDAEESMSYDMPTFKLRGQRLVYFAAWKRHCALYGLNLDPARADLAGYDIFKSTLRFPPAEPVPEPLLRRLLDERIAEIEGSATR